jgi:hypothetical protein
VPRGVVVVTAWRRGMGCAPTYITTMFRVALQLGILYLLLGTWLRSVVVCACRDSGGGAGGGAPRGPLGQSTGGRPPAAPGARGARKPREKRLAFDGCARCVARHAAYPPPTLVPTPHRAFSWEIGQRPFWEIVIRAQLSFLLCTTC